MSYQLQKIDAQHWQLHGELVFSTAKSLCAQWRSAFCEQQAYTLDLAGVQKFDSAGLVALLTAVATCQRAQAKLTLLNFPGVAKTLIDLYNLNSILG